MGQAKRLWELQRERLIDAFFDGSMGDVEFTEEALALDFTLEEIAQLLSEQKEELL